MKKEEGKPDVVPNEKEPEDDDSSQDTGNQLLASIIGITHTNDFIKQNKNICSFGRRRG